MEHMRAETKKGHKIYPIRRLVTDRGGEFTAKLSGKTRSPFNKACKKAGIKQFFTSAYDSSQNGKAERSNRSVAEGTRVALIDSHFGWSWWPEAAQYATYTLNRLTRPIPSKLRKSKGESSSKATKQARGTNEATTTRAAAYTRLTGLKANSQDLSRLT